jgi:3-mercaptopyruvate sulfurtransferase SseA
MKLFVASLAFVALFVWAAASPAQQKPRYDVDPQTKWAVGAKQKPADELKKELDSGKPVMIIDVRPAASFARESIPGAVNVPLAELENHLKTLPKDTSLVFT